MEVEDFSFCVDDSGTGYVRFKEHPTKTRQGRLNTKHRIVLPKMLATSSQNCPVEETPSSKCQEAVDNPSACHATEKSLDDYDEGSE